MPWHKSRTHLTNDILVKYICKIVWTVQKQYAILLHNAADRSIAPQFCGYATFLIDVDTIPCTTTAIHNWQAWCLNFSISQYEFKGKGKQLSVSSRASNFICQLQGKVISLFQFSPLKKVHDEDREFWYLFLHNKNCSYRIHQTNKQFLFPRVYFKPSWAQIPGVRSPRRLNFAPWRLILVVVDPRRGTASRHASGAHSFEVVPGFLECLCTSVLRDDELTPYINIYMNLVVTSLAASGRKHETCLTEYSRHKWDRLTEILQLMIKEWSVTLGLNNKIMHCHVFATNGSCCCVAALSVFKTRILGATQFRTICDTRVVTTNYTWC
jgi:hypothetical protein